MLTFIEGQVGECYCVQQVIPHTLSVLLFIPSCSTTLASKGTAIRRSCHHTPLLRSRSSSCLSLSCAGNYKIFGKVRLDKTQCSAAKINAHAHSFDSGFFCESLLPFLLLQLSLPFVLPLAEDPFLLCLSFRLLCSFLGLSYKLVSSILQLATEHCNELVESKVCR